MSEAILSDKANAFVLSVSSPPDWLIDLCRSPLGRSLFLYILKDSSLRAQFANGNYNGLVDFFVSTLIVDPATTYFDLKGISLSNCTLSTTLLFYERVLKSIAAASTYKECENLIASFVDQFLFSTAEELCIFFNYILEIQNAIPNPNVRMVLGCLSERVFLKAQKMKSLSPVGFVASSQEDAAEALLRRRLAERRVSAGHFASLQVCVRLRGDA